MPTLNLPQARFLALPHKFRLFVAGFGSGRHGSEVQGFVNTHGSFQRSIPAISPRHIRRLRIFSFPRLMKWPLIGG